MADNYTALKSSQKKRIISKETFNSLDLSTIPVGSEYEVVSPIEKGDLSADINNALNKAEKSISEPTNQTTGSDGDVLVKKGGGSEWKSMSTPGVVQGTGQSTTDVMSQKAVTDELTQRPIVTANPGGGTETLSTIKIGETVYTVASGGDPYTLPVATADKLGGVKSSTTGTTANRDYNVEVKTDGTMKVNVPWVDTDTGVTSVDVTGTGNAITGASISGRKMTLTTGETFALISDIPKPYSAGTHIRIDLNNAINAEWPTAADTGYEGVNKTGTITGITMNGESKGTSGVINLGNVLTPDYSFPDLAKLSGGNLFNGTQQINGELIVGTLGIRTNGSLATKEGKILKPLEIMSSSPAYEYTLPDKSGTVALTSDIPDTSNLSSFSVEVW